MNPLDFVSKKVFVAEDDEQGPQIKRERERFEHQIWKGQPDWPQRWFECPVYTPEGCSIPFGAGDSDCPVCGKGSWSFLDLGCHHGLLRCANCRGGCEGYLLTACLKNLLIKSVLFVRDTIYVHSKDPNRRLGIVYCPACNKVKSIECDIKNLKDNEAHCTSLGRWEEAPSHFARKKVLAGVDEGLPERPASPAPTD